MTAEHSTTPELSTASKQAISPKPRRRWRRWLFWFVLFPCGLITVIAVTSYYIVRYQAKLQRDEAIAEARGLGEPIWFYELKPAPLPPDEDGTPFVLRAIDLHDRVLATGAAHPFFLDQGSAYGNNKILPESLFDPEMPAAELAALRSQVAAEAEIPQLLRQALDQGRIQLPRDYDAADAIYFGDSASSSKVKDIAEAIVGQIALSVRDDDARQAVEQLHLLFQFSHTLRDEPTAVPQLARIAVGRLAVTGLTQALPRLELTDEQLLLLDADLELVADGVSMRDVVLAERAGIMTLSERVGEASEDDDTRFWLYRNFRAFQFHDQAALIRTMRFDADIADDNSLGLTEQSAAMHDRIESEGIFCLLTSLMSPAITNLRDAGLNHRQLLFHARLALRLDHYRRRTGALPETLEPLRGELPSAELTEIPLALRSHLPPVYRLTDAGYQLYDAGEDQHDGALQPRPTSDGHPLARPLPDVHETGTLLEVSYGRNADAVGNDGQN